MHVNDFKNESANKNKFQLMVNRGFIKLNSPSKIEPKKIKVC